MRTSDTIALIESSIAEEKKVRVYFKGRTPIYGEFVACQDHKDLMRKGFVRFVIDFKTDAFRQCNNDPLYSKIYSISEIVHITFFSYSKTC